MSKKLTLSLITALAVLGLLVSFFSGPKTENISSGKQDQKTELKVPDQDREVLDALEQVDSEAHGEEEEEHNHEPTDDSDDTALKAYPKSFNFKAESVKLSKLQKSYPESKRELLDIILNKNPYKTAKAHSAAELAQRQQGALKVDALKTIFKLEKDKSQLRQDLSEISQRADDPVIAKIAAAALESLNKGRPFFEDTTRAIENIPVPD
jgi:hypothetical protein